MDIKWKCNGCGHPLVTDSKYAGAKVECPKCKKSLVAPSIQALPAAELETSGETASIVRKEKGADEVYCRSCGEIIKKEAEICPHCGVRQRDTSGGEGNKSQLVAVLLAVFLGFWTWLYTYKKDAWKFWLNLILSIVTLGVWWATVGWIWSIIDTAVKDRDWYEKF